jgi:arylsulfatase A-like enzyme/Flp pilus assembly protein TadD
MPRALHPAGRSFATLLALVLLVACSRDPGSDPAAGRDGANAPPPSILLITLDTLRRDALGYIGGHDRTPALDALARDSARFDLAVTPVPLTLPAHVTMMTGLDPPNHGIRDNGQVLSPEIPTLAEALAAAGYDTAAFVSAFVLQRRFGLDRGFATYDDRLLDGAGREILERPAAASVAAARDWLGQRGAAPWFAWLHLYDPHHPYDPPDGFLAPGEQAGTRAAYDAEVAAVDAALAPLLDYVRGLDREVVVVVTADHGEAFGEHGEIEHGLFVYDTTIAVPMMWHAPGRIVPARFERAVPRLSDIAPTLLELAGLAAWPRQDGASLGPLLHGDGDRELAPAYIETPVPWSSYGWAPLRGWRERGHKLIDAPTPEVYDLDSDPGELRNIAGAAQAEADRLWRGLDGFVAAAQAPAAAVDDDPDTLARLASLGYLGTGQSAGTPDPDAADAKDRIEEYQGLMQAQALRRQGQVEQAMAAYADVLERQPRSPVALLRLAQMLAARGEPARAIELYRRLVEVQPGNAEAHFGLADALVSDRQFEAALLPWQETIALQPRRSGAWSNLASTLGWLGRYPEAIDAFTRAIEIDPDDPRLHHNLAAAAEAAGRRPEAIAALERAAGLEGPRFAAARQLGRLYLGEGRWQQAGAWLQRVPVADPSWLDARAGMVLAALKLDDPDLATRIVDDSESARPGSAAALRAHPELRPLLEPTP